MWESSTLSYYIYNNYVYVHATVQSGCHTLEEMSALSSGETGYQVGVAKGEITYEQLNAVLALEHSYYQ